MHVRAAEPSAHLHARNQDGRRSRPERSSKCSNVQPKTANKTKSHPAGLTEAKSAFVQRKRDSLGKRVVLSLHKLDGLTVSKRNLQE